MKKPQSFCVFCQKFCISRRHEKKIKILQKVPSHRDTSLASRILLSRSRKTLLIVFVNYQRKRQKNWEKNEMIIVSQERFSHSLPALGFEPATFGQLNHLCSKVNFSGCATIQSFIFALNISDCPLWAFERSPEPLICWPGAYLSNSMASLSYNNMKLRQPKSLSQFLWLGSTLGSEVSFISDVFHDCKAKTT